MPKSCLCLRMTSLCVLVRVKVKCKLVQALRLCTSRTAHCWSKGIALPFPDHGASRVWGVSVTDRPIFTPGKDPVPIIQEAGVDHRAVLDRCGKSRPLQGFDTRTVQPVTSRYTNYATRPTCVLVQPDSSLKNRSLYLRGARRITAASAAVMTECTLLTADANELRTEGMKLPPCAKPPLTVEHSSATASHSRRSERLMWITKRSLPSSFLMTRGETPAVIQPPVLCQTIKIVFLSTPIRTISYFM